MEKFRSKIDILLVLILSIPLGSALIRSLYDNKWFASGIIFLVICFVIQIFLTTYYCIEGQKLTIKSGFLVNNLVDILSIEKISETNSIMSSPALSLDRLEIFYGKNNSILISPKDKSGFFEAIKKINPEVEIVLKNKQN